MEDQVNRAANARKGSPFLHTAQAAHYLGLSPRTLERMRVLGIGPKYRKHGRNVVYHVDDLDAWSHEQEHAPTAQSAMSLRAHL